MEDSVCSVVLSFLSASCGSAFISASHLECRTIVTYLAPSCRGTDEVFRVVGVTDNPDTWQAGLPYLCHNTRRAIAKTCQRAVQSSTCPKRRYGRPREDRGNTCRQTRITSLGYLATSATTFKDASGVVPRCPCSQESHSGLGLVVAEERKTRASPAYISP